MFTLHFILISRFFSHASHNSGRNVLPRHTARGVAPHEAFHLFDGHLVEVAIDGILQGRCSQGKVKPLLCVVGIGQQAIDQTAHKGIARPHTVHLVIDVVDAGMVELPVGQQHGSQQVVVGSDGIAQLQKIFRQRGTRSPT